MSYKPKHSYSSSFPSRKPSASVPRTRPSRLKSWVAKLSSGAFTSTHPSSRLPLAQPYSQLLSRLPLEIRREIYAYVLHSYGIVQHVLLFNGKLTHMRCASPTSHAYLKPMGYIYNICKMHDTDYRNSMQSSWEVLSLLLSCRQTYLEFMEIVFSSITFRLTTDSATRLVENVPARYIALAKIHLSFAITSPMYLPPSNWPLGFTYPFRSGGTSPKQPKADEARWEAFWRGFAGVQVHALFVEILDSGMRIPEQALLGPLNNVRAEDFEVFLPWPSGLETSGQFEGASFVVRRPPEGTDLRVELNVERGSPGVGKARPIWRRLGRLR